jgi:hypothetical protein
MKRLEAASQAVRKATDNLVKAAQQALEEHDDADNIEVNKSAVNNVVAEIDARAEVSRMEKELEIARQRLDRIHKQRYQTDSETEQSGYESSGFDEANIRRNVYSPYLKHQSQQHQQQQQQQQQRVVRTEEQHTIESGPSFNESLERFRLATSSGNESDGDFSPAVKTSVFKQQRQAHQQHYSATTTSSQRTTTRAMEEQRTMITRSSQKSYHIE